MYATLAECTSYVRPPEKAEQSRREGRSCRPKTEKRPFVAELLRCGAVRGWERSGESERGLSLPCREVRTSTWNAKPRAVSPSESRSILLLAVGRRGIMFLR